MSRSVMCIIVQIIQLFNSFNEKLSLRCCKKFVSKSFEPFVTSLKSCSYCDELHSSNVAVKTALLY